MFLHPCGKSNGTSPCIKETSQCSWTGRMGRNWGKWIAYIWLRGEYATTFPIFGNKVVLSASHRQLITPPAVLIGHVRRSCVVIDAALSPRSSSFCSTGGLESPLVDFITWSRYLACVIALIHWYWSFPRLSLSSSEVACVIPWAYIYSTFRPPESLGDSISYVDNWSWRGSNCHSNLQITNSVPM